LLSQIMQSGLLMFSHSHRTNAPNKQLIPHHSDRGTKKFLIQTIKGRQYQY